MGRYNNRGNRHGLTVAVFLFVAALLTTAGPAAAAGDVIECSRDGLNADGGIKLDGPWKFQAGDDIAWADPLFDDSAWPMAKPDFRADQLPPGWGGIGWFRLHLRIDPDLLHFPLALSLIHWGASEIYLDGRKIHTLGYVMDEAGEEKILLSHSIPTILPIQFDDGDGHVLAIRFSYDTGTDFFGDDHHRIGIDLSLRDPIEASTSHEKQLLAETKMHVFFGSFAFAFSLLHLLLFVFYPKSKDHLYYSIFTFFAGIICFYPLFIIKSTDISAMIRNIRIMQIAIILVALFGIRFLYSVFYPKLPKIFWLWALLGGITAISVWNGPMTNVFVYCLVVFVENIRVLVRAIINRKPSSWIIAVGCSAFIVATSIQMTMAFGLLPDVTEKLYLHGLFAMLVFMSLYLARTHAHNKKKLERQVVQIHELSDISLEQEKTRMRLEADNALKEIELEEAHKRQKVLDELAAKNRELRDTQSQLIQSEKMASLGNLVAGVAHEINTPVGAISSMHNTMTRAIEKLKTAITGACPVGSPEEKGVTNALKVIEDANSVINSGTERVTDIVKRLRSFARLDEAEIKKVDIHEGIEDTLMLVHHQLKRHVTINKEFGNIPPISCFPGQLNQVYVNILINAGQAIEGTGEVSIKTHHKDGNVFVEISDTGKGISEDEISRIFDPGYTTKGVGVGTGLGLSICYQIIRAHKGDIEVTSEKGKGTTFSIRIPDNLDDLIETRDSHTPRIDNGA